MKTSFSAAFFAVTLAIVLSGCTHPAKPASSSNDNSAQPTFSKTAQKTMVETGVVMAEQARANSDANLLNAYAMTYASKHGDTHSFSDFLVPGKSTNEDIGGLSDLSLDDCTIADTTLDCTKSFRTINVTYRLENGQVKADIQKRF